MTNIYILNENSILETIAKEKEIILTIKSDQLYQKIYAIGISVREKLYIAENIINQKLFYENLAKVILENNIVVKCWDSKNIFRSLNLSYLHVKFFVDYKLYMFDRFGKNTELNDPNIKELTKLTYDTKKLDFHSRIYGFNNTPYQLLSFPDITKLINEEIEILRFISKLSIPSKRYIKILSYASYYYAELESSGIRINRSAIDKKGYESIKRYLPEYSYGEDIAHINYHFNHTSTGRLASPFHNYPKEKGSIIIPREENGKFISIDWNCFEFKVLLSYLNIKCNYDDPYKKIADEANCERGYAKNNIIKWMYGAKKFDKKVTTAIVKLFPGIQEKLNNLAGKVMDTLILSTPFDFDIKYETQNEAGRKYKNNLIQSIASYHSINFTCELIHIMKKFAYKSKVIATIYDEVIIDVHPTEFDRINKLINIMKEDVGKKDSNVKFTLGVSEGKNLMELKND
jgi:hypothetical protein